MNHSAIKSFCLKSAAFVLFVSLCSSCATRRYVRQQIAINNCVQVLKAIDREGGILYAAAEMDADRAGLKRSEIGEKAHDKTVLQMHERLKKRRETTEKMNEAGQ